MEKQLGLNNMEEYDKIKKVLAIGFMNFLDENKPKDKMCLSNGECADIEKAFNEQDWPKLVRYLEKYRESEDERIRKEIIKFIFFETGDRLSTEEQKRWIAYLEKQEQKPDIELVQRSWYMEGYHDREFGREPMWLITACDGGPRYEPNPKYGKKLAEEQKPAWGEEDEDIIENAIKNLNRFSISLYNGGNVGDSKKVSDTAKNLKSLRPSWKPSEEQMKALQHAIDACESEWAYQDDELRSLLNDLKKL